MRIIGFLGLERWHRLRAFADLSENLNAVPNIHIGQSTTTPEAPALRDPMPSSDLHTCTHTHAYTHTLA